jgi:hypothetical protein
MMCNDPLLENLVGRSPVPNWSQYVYMNSFFPSKKRHNAILKDISWQNIKICGLSHTLMLNYPAERHFLLELR